MATHLDLQEQEQIDQLKAFWDQYGNLITVVVCLALAAVAGWGYWQRHQAEQSADAGVLFREMEAAQQKHDASKAAQVLGDMIDHYPGTVYTAQAALLASQVQLEQHQYLPAQTSLQWVLDHVSDPGYQSVARLRLAGLYLDENKPDAALGVLNGTVAPSFAALVDDRRGDVLQQQGKTQEAIAAYQAAWKGLKEQVDYRHVVEAKLMVLGVKPEPLAGSAGASAADQGSSS